MVKKVKVSHSQLAVGAVGVRVPLYPELIKGGAHPSPFSAPYTDEDGIKYLYHGLSVCTEDKPLAEARGLFPCTGGQTVV